MNKTEPMVDLKSQRQVLSISPRPEGCALEIPLSVGLSSI